jgi:hypothetical protein
MTEDLIDLIANDGRRNAAGGIYSTRVYEFANAIEAEATAPLLARIAELEAQIATVAPAVDALTDDRIIDMAYECNAAPSVPESTLIDFARRIRYE